MDPTEHALVVQALTCTLSNCVLWVNYETARRVRADPANRGLTPEEIIRQVRDFARGGGKVEQGPETRPEYSHRRFWYRAVVPVGGFPRGLFVEMELLDDDPDVPVVILLNAHPAY